MARLFPYKRDIDPQYWQTHIKRNLIPELQTEVNCFYGPTPCIESQYPGLDYTKPNHRLRLNRFQYHRKLFRVIDDLRLTDAEIRRICCWQGTSRVKETFETTKKVTIRDTTWDGIQESRLKQTTMTMPCLRGGECCEAELEPIAKDEMDSKGEDKEEEEAAEEEGMDRSDEMDNLSDEESEDELQQSVGVELNQRLLAATEARARGEDAILDADWEQWLKEAAERGAIQYFPHAQGSTSMLSVSDSPLISAQGIPELLSESSMPEVATLQTSLPSTSQYFPLSQPNSLVTVQSTMPPPAGAM